MFRGVRIEKVTVFSRLDGEKPPYHNGPRRRVVRVGIGPLTLRKEFHMLQAFRRGKHKRGKKY